MEKIIARIKDLLKNSTKPLVVAISGHSGSGKSTVAQKIIDAFPEESSVFLHTDDYYIGKTRMQREMPAGEELNFDHPAAIDIERLVSDIQKLKSGNSIDSPLYDMLVSEPKPKIRHIEPSRLIVVEGIAANLPSLRTVSDISICVVASPEARLLRRSARDVTRKGYSATKTRELFEKYIEPSYQRYYAPHDTLADICIEN